MRTADQLTAEWADNPRWHGIQRDYSAEHVLQLSGTVRIEYSLARAGAGKFWRLLNTEPVVSALGAVTGNQAIQQVQAGLKAIYCSGWQVAGDGQFVRRDVSGPEPVPGRFGAEDGRTH